MVLSGVCELVATFACRCVCFSLPSCKIVPMGVAIVDIGAATCQQYGKPIVIVAALVVMVIDFVPVTVAVFAM